MPLQGSVGDRIKELHQARADGTASQPRSDKQIVAIALASKRQDQRKGRKARSR